MFAFRSNRWRSKASDYVRFTGRTHFFRGQAVRLEDFRTHRARADRNEKMQQDDLHGWLERIDRAGDISRNSGILVKKEGPDDV
jgi:hypothetical protein